MESEEQDSVPQESDPIEAEEDPGQEEQAEETAETNQEPDEQAADEPAEGAPPESLAELLFSASPDREEGAEASEPPAEGEEEQEASFIEGEDEDAEARPEGEQGEPADGEAEQAGEGDDEGANSRPVTGGKSSLHSRGEDATSNSFTGSAPGSPYRPEQNAADKHVHYGTSVIDLRGSRPNSAAIAAEIEGFEDDFLERVEEEEPESEEPEEEEQDLGPSVEELIEKAKQERARLGDQNETLQRRVRQALEMRNKGRPQMIRDLSKLDGSAARYKTALNQWVNLLTERERVESHFQTEIFDMKTELEERIKRADDIATAYKHFRQQVAHGAEYSKTGKAVSEKLIAELEIDDQGKEEEVQRVRLKHIHLANQLKRLEATLRQKEELAEGLHLIDFEQLKIENQSLNEKIEERNEELLKLRKKTTTTVQILTHVREKLQFVEKENEALAHQLEVLEQTLVEKREKVTHLKAQRDSLRQKGRKIKETSVYITNPELLVDLEAQRDRRHYLTQQIQELAEKHELLTSKIAVTNTHIMNVTNEIATSTSNRAALLSMGTGKGFTPPSLSTPGGKTPTSTSRSGSRPQIPGY